MSSLLIGIRSSSIDFQRIRVDNVSFESKIKNLKVEVASKANLSKDSFELVYCGNILDDEASLTSCGLKHGVMVHVLKKKAKDPPKPAQNMSEAEIQTLVLAFRALTRFATYRNALQRLSRPDILDNIIAITPGLSQDPVAISMIQNPELLARMGDIDTVRRIVEVHPALAEVANHIVASVHEDCAQGGSQSAAPASGYSYSLEALSDDDEMDSSQSSDSQHHGLSRQASYSTITAAHLAAAIASASGAGSGSGENTAITSEMFNQAMQRTLSSIATPSTAQDAPAAASGTGPPAGGLNLQRQLQQMRELGLTDDALNLHVLALTGGNVHDAIDLVYSGTAPPPP
ncbi:ubiquitin-like protein 7 [Nilaparvata lugens]|uniref:ubiquitin-like protein 7 n=1 Tax=Nilaparvata lugens TaxID=108931 RepID=UPI00193E076B|nr:ubiquitin-like protein 7 [Nilaparvata lugens]